MVYTNKDKVRVVIVMDRFRVEGDMHVLAGSRLTDALNSKSKDFLAVTAAAMYSLDDGELAYETDYIAVNRDAIAAIFPLR